MSIFLGLILSLLHLLLLLLGLFLGSFGDFIGLDHAGSVVESWLVASLLLVLLVVLGRVDCLASWRGLDMLFLLLLQVVHFDLPDVSTGNCSVRVEHLVLLGHLGDVVSASAGEPQQILRHLLVEGFRALDLRRLLNVNVGALGRV